MNLLIVDDESHLVDSMKASIPWNQAGIVEVYGAYSAKEALDYLQSYEIDIVLSDVRMPGINGIELVRTIKENWPHISCIMLSGYAEFEYVKQAMHIQASEYLLKPVRDEQLLSSTRGIVELRRQEKEKENSHERAQTVLRHNLPMLRSNLLNELVSGKNLSESILTTRLNTFDIRLQYSDNISILLFKLDDRQGKYPEVDWILLSYAASNIIEELLQPYYEQWYCEDLYGNLLFVVKQKETDGTSVKLKEIADSIRRVVLRLLELTVSIVISQEGPFPEFVISSYQQGIISIAQQLAEDKDFVVQIGEEQYSSVPQVLTSLHSPPLFIHFLEAGQWDGAREKLKEIIWEWETKFTGSNEHMIEIYYSLSVAFAHFIHKSGRQAIGYPLLDGGKMQTIRQLEQWAMTLLNYLHTEMREELTQTRRSLVTRIQKFIQDNLAQDVSLEGIAEHVHMHPTHVSKVYKSITGENISDYLLKIRMERAVYLLQHTSYKILEISKNLGYRNPSYFTKVFRGYFGVAPQEFR